jgi:ADP-heptose:LPS heptosyltransferase
MGKKIKAIDIVPAVWTMLKIKLFSRRNKKSSAIINKDSVKSILVFRIDRFGEFLLNIPAIRSLKINYPTSRLVLAVDPYVHELAASIDKVDEVIDWENRKHNFIELLRFSKRIREKRFSICVILNPSKELNIVSFLAGIPIRLGYDRKWGFLLTHKIEDVKYLGYKHEVEYNLELVRSLGLDIEDKRLFISVGEALDREVDNLLEAYGLIKTDSLVILHPWTSDPIKQWPVDNFLQLSRRLSGEYHCKVVIIGGKDEISQSERFCAGRGDLINLTGKLTLRQLAAFFKKCRCIISNDSGPVHLASAVGTPVIAIFRNDIPGKSSHRWGPWGSGHMVIEKDNLNKITVDEVLDKIRILLGR